MCRSLLLNTWEEMTSLECQQHPTRLLFSLSWLEGWRERKSHYTPSLLFSLVWDAASWPHGRAVMLPPLCGSTKRSDQIWCSTFRDIFDFLYSKSKVNALHLSISFVKYSCILDDCTRKIFLARNQTHADMHKFQQEVTGEHVGCRFNFCLIATA